MFEFVTANCIPRLGGGPWVPGYSAPQGSPRGASLGLSFQSVLIKSSRCAVDSRTLNLLPRSAITAGKARRTDHVTSGLPENTCLVLCLNTYLHDHLHRGGDYVQAATFSKRLYLAICTVRALYPFCFSGNIKET